MLREFLKGRGFNVERYRLRDSIPRLCNIDMLIPRLCNISFMVNLSH